LRGKEASAASKEIGDMKTNLAAMTKAIDAISAGMGGAFLQSGGAIPLRRLSVSIDMSDVDREVLSSFLATGNSEDYAPKSGQIVGILKQMRDTMSKDLADAEAQEAASKEGFEGLVAAKEKQVEALTKEIEDKIQRVGNGGVQLSQMQEDLDDTKQSLEEDKKFLADLEKGCATKDEEWAARSKTRNEELLAIAETIKILNDDDALELFKKTLPAPALLQMETTSRDMKYKAMRVLKEAPKDFRLNLISLALAGKKVSFDKVIAMIDNMVGLLNKEQTDDAAMKEQCERDIDRTEDEAKQLDVEIGDLGKATDTTQENIANLVDEIASLVQGINDLDRDVAEATSNRQEEHEDNTDTIAADNSAIELLGFAKNRLNKFYNPKLFKAPPKRELSEEERVTSNMGGTLAPTAAPGGIAGTGVTALVQDAPPPPPETWGAYAKKSEESNGVVAMVDMLIADLDKEVQTITVEEREAQAEYVQYIQDSAAKRASDSKSVTDNEAAKAAAEADLQRLTEETHARKVEMLNTLEVLSNFHKQCDWLLANFDLRRDARNGEIDSLKKAKAVLSGADFS
jgi:hypothetical protein